MIVALSVIIIEQNYIYLNLLLRVMIATQLFMLKQVIL